MWRVKACGFIISLVISALGAAPIASAESSFSWLKGDVSSTPNDNLLSPYEFPPQACHTQKVFVGQLSLNQEEGCFYQQDGFRYGNLNAWVQTGPWSGYWDKDFVVGFPNESHMYRVQGMPKTYIPIPHSKDLLIHININPGSRADNLYIVRNFASQLIRVVGSDMTVSYKLPDDLLSTPVFYDESGEKGVYATLSVSNNGQWLVFERSSKGGFTRVNLKTLETRWFSWYEPSQVVGLWGKAEFSISDDGTRVAVAGRWVDLRVYELTENCGSVLMSMSDHIKGGECPYVSLWTQAASGVNDDMEYSTFPRLNADGGELTVSVVPIYRSVNPHNPRWMTLTAAGYSTSKLDYLALGDSYSSGEGDIEKNKQGGSYYQTLTDVGNYNCHISSRSYPFLLRDLYNIPADKMHSVACSGARVMFDYFKPHETYLGQGNRIASKSPSERAILQQDALDRFTPGLTSQLEFIKKNQPKVVTLTGGGNDVGFADILKYCAGLNLGLVVNETCGFASDATLRQMLGVSIRNQYDYTKLLIELIQQASPSTVVYIVGYPSFIAGSDASCTLNSGFLNGRERDMLNESVTYINNVLKHAAQVSGARYISIEDSLKGGRLCEGAAYVTGVVAVGVLSGDDEKAQSFHPNSSGHQKIAESIYQDKDFSVSGGSRPVAETDDGAPDLPLYFQGDMDLSSATQYPMSLGKAIVQSSMQLTLPDRTFQSSTATAIEVYSQPTSLGNFTTSSDGSLSAQVTLPPSIKPGYHVIVVSGISPSGEAIKYYQFIEVQSDNPNDFDADGIPNASDNCQYIKHWYNETSGKDVCAVAMPVEPAQSRSSATTSGKSVIVENGVRLAQQLPYGNDTAPTMATPADRPVLAQSMVLGSRDSKPAQAISVESKTKSGSVKDTAIAVMAAAIVAGMILYITKKLR